MSFDDSETVAPHASAVLCDVRWMISRQDHYLNRELLTLLDAHGQSVTGLSPDDAMGIDAAVVQVVRIEGGLRDLANWVERANQRRQSSLRCLETWYPDAMNQSITALENGDVDRNTLYGAERLANNGDEAIRTRLPEIFNPTPNLRAALERLGYLRYLVNAAYETTSR